MSNLNLEKYAQIKKDKEKQRKKCYKNILQQINNIIMIKMDHGANNIIYTIPMFIIGESEYDPLESIEYVIKKLTKQLLEDLLNIKNQLLLDQKSLKFYLKT